MRFTGTVRTTNQSIIKEINPNYSLEGLMLKLKLQYSGHLMQTADSLEEILMLGKVERKGRRGRQRVRWLDSITCSMDMNTSKQSEGRGDLACCSPWDGKESDTIHCVNNNNKFEISYLQTCFEKGYPPTFQLLFQYL